MSVVKTGRFHHTYLSRNTARGHTEYTGAVQEVMTSVPQFNIISTGSRCNRLSASSNKADIMGNFRSAHWPQSISRHHSLRMPPFCRTAASRRPTQFFTFDHYEKWASWWELFVCNSRCGAVICRDVRNSLGPGRG